MRFLVDECTGPAVARWLREQSHEVFSVYEDARGMADEEVLGKACAEGRILLRVRKTMSGGRRAGARFRGTTPRITPTLLS